MRISEIARETGLTIDTIRFYEKRGLLDAAHFKRSTNRYRDYSETAVSRLLLIKQGQAAGLTLAEIANWIDAWETDQLTFEEKEAFFLRKVQTLESRIAQLEGVKTYLVDKIRTMAELHAAELESERALP